MLRISSFAIATLSLGLSSAPYLAAQSDPARESHAARMEQEHRHDAATPSPAVSLEPRLPVSGRAVVYGKLGETVLTGYLAHPAEGAAPRAAIVVIQEWWGLNDHVRAMARRFAGEGYTALAVDLYEGKVATTSEEASSTMRAAMATPERLTANLGQAIAHLRGEGKATKVGVVGWCFGGGWTLATALAFPDQVDAAVMYYGRTVADPAELAKLKAPLLGLFGALDQGIPLDGVRAMEAELGRLGKQATIVVYPDADHAFANPTGTRYQEAAATDAWQRTVAFFAVHLK